MSETRKAWEGLGSITEGITPKYWQEALEDRRARSSAGKPDSGLSQYAGKIPETNLKPEGVTRGYQKTSEVPPIINTEPSNMRPARTVGKNW